MKCIGTDISQVQYIITGIVLTAVVALSVLELRGKQRKKVVALSIFPEIAGEPQC